MKRPYFSFICSYLDYANIAWASTYKSILIYLYRNQEHAIRIIYDKDRFVATEPLFWYAKAITLYEINLFQIISLIFQCKHRTTLFVFHNLYTLKPPSKYSLRRDRLLPIPLGRTKFAQFSINVCGPYLWCLFIQKKIKRVYFFSLNDATMSL